MFNLSGKTALVTGATGGIGGAVARALHAASPLAAQALAEIDLRDDNAWAGLEGATGAALLRHADRLGEIPAERLRWLTATLTVFQPARCINAGR